MSTQMVTTAGGTADAASEIAHLAAFSVALRRATDAVEAETACLRAGRHRDLKSFEHRKSQVLLDLSRLHASLPRGRKDGLVEERLRDLRRALSENMTLLDRHMQAVQEITDLLARTLLAADSDGTYAPQGVRAALPAGVKASLPASTGRSDA
ncbi:hypothetical protein [Roseibium aestuarii]|uniref:Flagellar protein FlgN n=1 Tax=Roseibium aestuarii TaxID=2600299 RepID=A0ABW4JXG6_9HYPH|nr:hypothetical protein [Roseibium aestuarii]